MNSTNINKENMVDEENQIPKELKCFNWGAFFWNGIWGIRHGVWISLLTIIPIFGWFIMPIILGFKGNVWAWKKNTYFSVDSFLKSQRIWAISGVIFFVLFFGILFYAMNFSSSINMALDFANKNDSMIKYFGYPIKKNSLFANVSYSNTAKLTTATVDFSAKGPKNKGRIKINMVKQNEQWIAEEMQLEDSERNIINLD